MGKYKVRIESHDLIPTSHFSSMYPIMMVKPNDYFMDYEYHTETAIFIKGDTKPRWDSYVNYGESYKIN